MRNISYEDEIFMLDLVLQELASGAALDVQSTRFLDRYQADVAFLDEALADISAALCDSPRLPNRLSYLRSLHRVQIGFVAYLSGLAEGSSALGKALAPLSDTLRGMAKRHADGAHAVSDVLREAAEGKPSEQTVISDEEFRILLADEGPAE